MVLDGTGLHASYWAGALPKSQSMPSPLRKDLASCLSISSRFEHNTQSLHSILGVQAHLSLGQSTHLLWLQLGHPTEAPAGPSMGHESLVLTGVELAQDKVGKHQPYIHPPPPMFLLL